MTMQNVHTFTTLLKGELNSFLFSRMQEPKPKPEGPSNVFSQCQGWPFNLDPLPQSTSLRDEEEAEVTQIMGAQCKAACARSIQGRGQEPAQ